MDECDQGPGEGDRTEGDTVSVVIDAPRAGLRLDQLLVGLLPESSRSRIAAAIRAGDIRVDGERRKAGYRVKQGEAVQGSLVSPPPLAVKPEPLEFPVLYEDEVLVVLSKPPGLVVHPGSGNFTGTLVNGLVYYCNAIAGVGDAIRPGLVHRLDKDTSGVMVVAKDQMVHRLLVAAFADRQVKKEYLALLHGVPVGSQGRIVAPIGRHPGNRQKMAVQEWSGRYAVSNWRVVRQYGDRFCQVRVGIETGRTHQIRVHMAHLGHPVAGDTLYGAGRNNRAFPRQMLHAWRLGFAHPLTGEALHFQAPLWDDMARVCARLAEEEEPQS
ncbi:MAG: RluA family pseudouridine synthase [Desulfopila sp.]